MPKVKVEQTPAQAMDTVLDEVSEAEEKSEAQEPDEEQDSEGKEEVSESEEAKEGEKEEEPKLDVKELQKRVQSEVDKQMASNWKQRDELRRTVDDLSSKLEEKEYDKRLNALLGDDDETTTPDGKVLRRDAWEKSKEVVIDYQKNSRKVEAAMKAIDSMTQMFDSGTAERLGLLAKDPINRIHNLTEVISRMDNEVKQHQSVEFYLELRDKGLAGASEKDSILKRLGETESSREWNSEAKAIRQELSAKKPKKIVTSPDSSKGGAMGAKKGRKPTFEELRASHPDETEKKVKSGEWIL